jgi:DNA polymerase elongation subunit (family B)
MLASATERRVVTFNQQPSAYVLTDELIMDPLFKRIEPTLVFERSKTTYAYETVQSKQAVECYLGSKAHQTIGFDVTPSIRLFNDRKLQRSGMVTIDADGNMHSSPDASSDSIPLRTLFFDFEVYSANHVSFPNPYHYTDIIYMVSVIHLDGDKVTSYVCVVGGKESIRKTEQFTVVEVVTEHDLIMWFLDNLKVFDPDFISGYNIGFDIGYLEKRCILTNIELKWSRCHGKIGPKNIQTKYVLETFGRVCLDVYDYYKPLRSNYGFERLSLNAVAAFFLGEKKVDLPYTEQFAQYKKYLEMNRDNIGADNIPYKLCEYCHVDSLLAMRLFQNEGLIPKAIAFSNRYSATIRNVMQGSTSAKFSPFLWSQIKSFNYIYNGDPEVSMNRKVSGGYVMMSRPGIYRNVFIGDFASLYPSIMIAYNICWSTLDDNKDSPKTNHWAIPIQYEIDDVPIEETLYFKKSPKGLIPIMLEKLIADRKVARKKPGIDAHNEQLVIKTIANALCGYLGCRSKSRYVKPRIFVAITQTGQRLIQRVNQILGAESHIYSDTDSSMLTLNVVSYLQLNYERFVMKSCEISEFSCKTCDLIKNYAKTRHTIELEFDRENANILICAERVVAFAKAHQLCEYVSSHFPAPIKFEFETYVSVGIFMARKLYIAMKNKSPLNLVADPKYSGVCIKKTNYSKFLK